MRWPWVLVVIVAVVALDARFLGVGFVSDDFVAHGHAADPDRANPWTGPLWGLDNVAVWRPMLDTAFRMEAALFGVNPLPAQVHSILWHVATALLILRILRQLGAGPAGAAAGALLFAAEPLLTQSVGWINGRNSMPPATLTLLAVSAWLGYRARGRRSAYAVALGAAVFAVLWKESGFLAFAGPLFVDLVRTRPRPRLGALARAHLPFAAAAAALIVLRGQALGRWSGAYFSQDSWTEIAGRAGVFVGSLPAFLSGFPAGAAWADDRVRVLAVVVAGAALVFGLAHPERRRVLILPFALLLVQLAFHAAFLPELGVDTGYRWFGAFGWWCCILGAAGDPRGRPAALLVPFILLGAFVAAHIGLQADLVAGSRGQDVLLGALRKEVAALPEGTTQAFVLDVPTRWPFLVTGFRAALEPPFTAGRPPCPVYPVHDQFRPEGPESVPVELLLRARGESPVVLLCRPGGRIERFESSQVISPSRARELADDLAVRRLELVQPASDRITAQVPVEPAFLQLRTPGIERLDYCVFTTEVAGRIPARLDGPYATLSKPLIEVRTFTRRGEPFYILPIGFVAADPPLLGPLLTYSR